jgi:hypothetical protein
MKSNFGAEPSVARAAFSKLCSQCHATGEVDKSPPRTESDVQSLLLRMSANGMKATPTEIGSVRAYLTETYVKSP